MFDIPAEAWEPLEKSPEILSFVLADEGKQQRGLQPPPRDPEQRAQPLGTLRPPEKEQIQQLLLPQRGLVPLHTYPRRLLPCFPRGLFPPAAVVAGDLPCDALAATFLPGANPAPIFLWDRG